MFDSPPFKFPPQDSSVTNAVSYGGGHESGRLKLSYQAALVYWAIALLVCGLSLAALLGERLNNKQYVAASRTAAQERLSLIRSRLEGNLYGDIQLVKGLVSVIATHPRLTQEEFTRAAKPLFDGGTNLRNIGAAPDMVIRLMYPLAGNESAIGLDYRKTPSQHEMADQARRTGRMILAGPLQLAQGGIGVVGRIPVFIEDDHGQKRFWGLISAVMDVERLYRSSGLLDSDMPLKIALRGKDAKGSQGEVFFGDHELFDADPVLVDITLPNGSWQMAAVPRGGWPTQADNAWGLRLIFLLISLLVLVPFFALARALNALGNAQRQIESEKQRLSATLENTPNVAVQWYDRAGRVIYWNRASEKIFGWMAKEAVGKTLDRLIYTPDQARHFAEMLMQVANTGATLSPFDSEAKHRDGSTRIFSSTLFSIPGDAEPIFVCMAVDITERKHAEESLRRSKTQFDAILSATTEGIFLVGKSGNVLAVNPTAAQRLGTTPEAMIGRCVFDFFPPELAMSRRVTMEEVMHNSKPKYIEDERNGRCFSQFYYPVTDENGEATAMVVFAIDITSRKMAEDSLRHLNETLEHRVQEEVAKNREKDHLLIQQSRLAAIGEMIHNIAHQWRQPISTLALLLANIRDAYEYKELDKEYLDGAVDKGQQVIQRMSSTIDDFRNFFRPGRKNSPFTLQEGLASALVMVEAVLKNNEILLSILPAKEISVNGHANEFAQVLVNIITNAKDAIMEKSIHDGRIDIAIGQENDRAWLSVTDNGGGIPDKILGKVFDPYFTTKGVQGSGIGLYMSKMIMTNMGGDIVIRNVGNGTEVRLTLPLASNSEV